MGWAYASLMAVLLVAGLLVQVARVLSAGGRPIAVARSRRVGERVVGALLSGTVTVTALWSIPLAAIEADVAGVTLTGLLAAPEALRVAGLFVVAAGVGLVIAAQTQMGAAWRLGVDPEADELVHRGLFRRVRHPIYSGFGLVFAGAALVAPAWPVGGVSIVGWAALFAEARLEERALLERFGPTYAAYLRRTGRFLPRFGRAGAETSVDLRA